MLIALSLLSFISILSPSPSAQANPATVRSSQSAASVTGVVRDSSGGVVSGATVIARAPSGAEQRTVTGLDGRFTISLPAPFDLTIRAGGFAENTQSVTAAAAGSPLEVVLVPGSVSQQVTVTATRGEERLADVPASVTVLNKEDIQRSPAIVADDLLRQLPQFSLFRRASSLAAHPTSQGVSLRGIGPSGVSRSLVLVDGVPYNDPFGGWVYWTGIPLESADRLEVVDNASSSLYGNYAMGGVINILTSKPTPRTVELKTQYGNRNTPKVDFRASDVWNKLGVSVDGAAFNTDGYPNVVPSERRSTDQSPPGVDNKINAQFHDVNVRAQYAASDSVQLFGHVGYFKENRDNGKASTYDSTGTYIGGQTEEANDTLWKTTSVGTRIQLPDQSTLQATLFTDNETFHSNFLAVPGASPTRSIGRISLLQTVPTKAVGGMAQWTRAFGVKQVVSAGWDWRWIEGESQETSMDAQKGLTPVTARFSGGDQRLMGVFVQDIVTPMSKLQLTFSARVDHWRNYNAHNLETTIATGAPTANYKTSCSAATPSVVCLADRADTVGSPRAAALYHVTDKVSVWGDYGLGFRAPTLNELYRQFQVGAILTRANDQLGPEHLKGGEFGVNLNPLPDLTLRGTWFDNRVKDPVSNVTIGTNLQQRQNLGRTRIAGLQTDVEYRFGPSWRFSGSYLYESARVVESNATIGLPAGTNLATNCPGPNSTGTSAGTGTGEACFLAEVPKNRGALRVTYSNAKYATVALGVQFVGAQFDDDQNARVIPAAALEDAGYAPIPTPIADPKVAGLPRYTLVDLTASRAVGRGVDVFLSAENLLNKDYFIGTVPTLLGPPRLVTVGFRVRFQGQ